MALLIHYDTNCTFFRLPLVLFCLKLKKKNRAMLIASFGYIHGEQGLKDLELIFQN